MYKEREMLQRLLDGELNDSEREHMLKAIDADPVLKREYEGFAETILALEDAKHPSAPPFFTAEVMRRLPEQRAPFWKQASLFLFRPHTVRWNMATLAFLLLAALFASVFLAGRGAVQTAAPEQGKAQAVMVAFRLQAPGAQSVALAGEFNKWMKNEILLTRTDTGEWYVEVPLRAGTYAYMFVIDGRTWMPDPSADAYRDDGFGSRNSVRRVYHL